MEPKHLSLGPALCVGSVVPPPLTPASALKCFGSIPRVAEVYFGGLQGTCGLATHPGNAPRAHEVTAAVAGSEVDSKPACEISVVPPPLFPWFPWYRRPPYPRHRRPPYPRHKILSPTTFDRPTVI